MLGPTHIETAVDVMRSRKKNIHSHHSRLLSIQEGRHGKLLDNSPPRNQRITKIRQ